MSSAGTDSLQYPFPFFVGSGRSGTTLVQAMFSSHPALAVVHESQFIPRLAGRYTRGRFAAEAFLNDVARSPDFRRLHLDLDELRQRLLLVGDYPQAVREIFTCYAVANGKSRYGDKTPGYVLDLDLLARLFPEARFVHVIRDGRDVAMSYLERQFGPGDLGQAALYWRQRVTAGQDSGARLGPQRYQELRYEELIDDPEETLKKVCGFIALEYDPSMLRYFERVDQLTAAAADPGAHQSLSLPPTRGLRDWRTQMEPADVALFERLAGGTLASLGYHRASERASPATLLKAAAIRGRWFRARLVNRVGRTINRGRRAFGRPRA